MIRKTTNHSHPEPPADSCAKSGEIKIALDNINPPIKDSVWYRKFFSNLVSSRADSAAPNKPPIPNAASNIN